MKSSYSLLLALFLIISCKPSFEPLTQKNLGDVRSIETIFISHQSDTKDKDNKRVALAHFNPDGTMSTASQFMTYPYTYMDKSDFSFWAEPNKDMFLHIMDGLTLGHAEHNFIYGNDWPKYYAEMIDKEGHPEFPKRQDLFSGSSSTIEFHNILPNYIKTELNLNGETDWYISSYEEKFDYDAEKVVLYDRRHVPSEKMIKVLQYQDEKLNKKLKPKIRVVNINPSPNKAAFKSVAYEYDGNNLIAVREDDREYKFVYEDDALIKSEYYVNSVLRNHRVYFYKANGLKEKTIIYNTYNEAEYTILYRYDFYTAG